MSRTVRPLSYSVSTDLLVRLAPPRPRRAERRPRSPAERGTASPWFLVRGGAWAAAVLACVALAIFLTAPRNGDYWWSDTPRHAMDGLFYLDLLRAMPLHDLRGWALGYYTQYPALTVGFYPPLGHLAFTLGYAVFGVAHWVPVAVVALFFWALLCGVFALARTALRGIAPPWAVFCAALMASTLVAASPQMLCWGQQAMLDIPALAFATWSAWFLLRYAADRRVGDLALFAAFALCALYTKQTVAIPLAGATLGLLIEHRTNFFRRRHVWIIAAVSAVALVPLALLTLRFAAFDLVNVGSRPDLTGVPPRASLGGVAWYAVHLPAMFGWPLIVLAVAGLALRAIRRPALPLVLGWLIVTYLMLTLIALKEERHGLTLAVPLAVLASGALAWLLGQGARPRLAGTVGGLVVLASLGAFAASLAQGQTPVILGYHQAADDIVRLMPQGGRVLFSGNRDGAFTADIRFMDPDRRYTVLRVDKMFLHVAVQPGLGLHPRDLTQTQVSAMLDRYGVQYVVSEPNLWLEAPVMREFDSVLHSPQFKEVERIPVEGPTAEKEVVIYRNQDALPARPEAITPEIMGGVVSTGE